MIRQQTSHYCYVWQSSFIYGRHYFLPYMNMNESCPTYERVIHMWDMSRSHICTRHDSLLYMNIYVRHDSILYMNIYVRHDSLPYMNIYVRHDSLPYINIYVRHDSLPYMNIYVKHDSLPYMNIYEHICETWLAHTWDMTRSYVRHEWVVSHVWMSYVEHMNKSCHTYEWGMSHMWMSSFILLFLHHAQWVTATRCCVVIYIQVWHAPYIYIYIYKYIYVYIYIYIYIYICIYICIYVYKCV